MAPGALALAAIRAPIPWLDSLIERGRFVASWGNVARRFPNDIPCSFPPKGDLTMSDETVSTPDVPTDRLQMELDRVAHLFAHHPPTSPEIAALHDACRSQCRGVAQWMLANIPECVEREYAITRLRQVMFWGNAAIACHQPQAAG